MIERIVKKIINLRKSTNTLKISSTDFFLISYPRSGNTWSRVLFTYTLFPNAKVNSLIDLQSYIPDIHFSLNNKKNIKYKNIHEGFKLIKSHEQFNDQYKKIIYIYRNPLDVAWSYFNFLSETKGTYKEIGAFVEDFLEGKVPFDRWDNHLQGWKNAEKVILFSYEDILLNQENFVEKSLEFMQVTREKEAVLNAMHLSSPEKVKKITNDKKFYGNKIPNFVRSPFEADKEKKQEFKENYTSIFKKEFSCYDFNLNRLK